VIFWIIVFGGFEIQIGDLTLKAHRPRIPSLLLVFFYVLKLFLQGGKSKIKEFQQKIEALLQSDYAIWYILGIFALLYSWSKISQYLSFHIHAVDFSVFDYAISNTLHGRFMYAPFLNTNLFSIHFAPILLLIVPLYLLHDGPFILLILQALIVVLGALPFYKLCRELFPEPFVAPLLTIAYLNYPFLIKGLEYDFHWEMAIPWFIFTAFCYLVKLDTPKYFLFVILALMTKEDVAIYTFALGAYLCVFQRRWKVGIPTMVLSAVWFVAAIQVISALSGGQLVYLGRWHRYGSTPFEIAAYALLHPLELFKEIVRPGLLAKLLLPLIFLPLLKPSLLLLAIPPYIVNATSSYEVQSKLYVYYAAPIIPFLFIAMVYGLKNLTTWFATKREALLWTVCLLLVVLNFGQFKSFAITPHHRIGYEVLKQIPREASVAAQVDLVPHLPKRQRIYMLDQTSRNLDVEYVVFDKKGNKWPMSVSEYEELFSSFSNNKKYRLIFEKDGYALFRRVQGDKPLSPSEGR
jgi:uncharacterized membrane protein